MDRNELVEKAARAMYEDRVGLAWDTGTSVVINLYRKRARAAVDAILPDVIEALRADAAQIAEQKAIQLNNSGISLPESEWVRAMCKSKGAAEAAAAIRAAVLGDALKGGK